MAYSSTLTIEELAGQRRVLVLRGSALPFWGANWGGKNALVTTWYPGNGDEATQQILGPQEMPSSWSGEWSRTLLSRNPPLIKVDGRESPIVSPPRLRDALRDILRSGIRLRVTWSVDGGLPEMRDKIVREGRAAEWDFKGIEGLNIEWSARFDWQSTGGAKRVAISSREDSLIAQTAASIVETEAAINSLAITQRVAGIRSDRLSVRGAPNSISLGALERMADAPRQMVRSVIRQLQQQVNSAKRIMGIAKKLRNTPFEIANAALDFAANTIAIVNQFTDEMGQRPAELNITSQKAADVVRGARDFGKGVDDLEATARRAQIIAQQFRAARAATGLADVPSGASRSAASARGRILTIHTVKSGDTPLSLSLRYYDTPDRTEDILRANRLPIYQTTLRLGAHIVIPAVSSGSSSTG